MAATRAERSAVEQPVVLQVVSWAAVCPAAAFQAVAMLAPVHPAASLVARAAIAALALALGS